MTKVKRIQTEVRKLTKIAFLSRYFKTGKGEYAENDKFLGIASPQLRALVKEESKNSLWALPDLKELLQSPYNEERSLSLMFLTKYYKDAWKTHDQFYIQTLNLTCSTTEVKEMVPDENQTKRAILFEWAKSDNLWERRIAIVSTHAFLREKDFSTTIQLAKLLLHDEEDLIHKAVGWMLRVLGQQDRQYLVDFLNEHACEMPRVMLRYAIENFQQKT